MEFRNWHIHMWKNGLLWFLPVGMCHLEMNAAKNIRYNIPSKLVYLPTYIPPSFGPCTLASHASKREQQIRGTVWVKENYSWYISTVDTPDIVTRHTRHYIYWGLNTPQPVLPVAAAFCSFYSLFLSCSENTGHAPSLNSSTEWPWHILRLHYNTMYSVIVHCIL